MKSVGIVALPGKERGTRAPQPCPTLPGDIDGNGLVNGNDIAGLLLAKLLPPLALGKNPTCADFGNGGDLALDSAVFVNALLLLN